ncbi:MAG: glycosyltransferase [Bacteroidetes bacterium]|nr:glycosyltransferase [Bacteroidota bacterium]
MSNEVMVSVLMTSYNREKYIAEAIESVLASSYNNFELIIVDDGSTDKTVEIARHYAAKDGRIQLHINEKNLGDYPNRNKAVSYAGGKYIMFCDSDDKFFEDTIEYCVSAMEKEAADFGMYYSRKMPAPFIMNSAELIKHHFFKSPLLVMGPGGTIFKKSFFEQIGGYPEKYGPANDMYFNLKAAKNTNVLMLPKLFLYYRLHEGQEQKNLIAYIHFNYCYMRDALRELNLPLTSKEIDYLSKKNKRRFVSNCINQFKKEKKISTVKMLWQKTGFRFRDMIEGIFH